MVRVPDGKRVPVGPWDLDHLHNVMAMPMVRTYVNGRLKGGLWFSMPGPQEIAEERLTAEFGFEADDGENELVLELIERDRPRMGWDRLSFFELREDDRRPVSLEPATTSHPRIFVHPHEVDSVRRSLARYSRIGAAAGAVVDRGSCLSDRQQPGNAGTCMPLLCHHGRCDDRRTRQGTHPRTGARLHLERTPRSTPDGR